LKGLEGEGEVSAAEQARLPSCFSCYGEGPCERCLYAEACKLVRTKFVPKSALRPVYEKVREMELKLRS